jgi:hypothetical protein
MRNHQIAYCCKAAIHERGIDVLNLKRSLPDVSYLCCDNCGESYRLSVASCESLGTQVCGTRYDIIVDHLIEIKGEDEMESGFQHFLVDTESQYYATLKFVAYGEESKQIDELKEEVN